MHEQDLEDLAVISATMVRLQARAEVAGNVAAAESVNDIGSSCMAWLCLTIGVDGAAVRTRSAQLLSDARSGRDSAVH